MARDAVLQELFMRRGTVARIAAACGLTKAAVYAWDHVPVDWLATVSEALNVPPAKLRPDLRVLLGKGTDI